MAEKKKALSKKRIKDRIEGAKSLAELKGAIEALDAEGGEALTFRYKDYKAPTFGGTPPKHIFGAYTQKAKELGLIRGFRWLWKPELISWDETAVLVRGFSGLMLMGRVSFEDCFSSIFCPFCGERYVFGYQCAHAMALNDLVVQYWLYENARITYLEYLTENRLWFDFWLHVPKALPGVVLVTDTVQGPIYKGRATTYRVWFAPDELLNELRLKDEKQWDWDVDHNTHSRWSYY